MRLKEIIVEQQIAEIGDNFRAGLYTNLGIGGGAGNAAAHKKYFTDNFKKQLKLNTSKNISKQEAIERLATSFMKKYGVSDTAIQSPEFQDLVTKAGNEKGFLTPQLNHLIDRMYLLATTTVQQSPSMQAMQQQQAGAGTAGTGQPTLSDKTQQVIAILKSMKGQSNSDDLEIIAKVAMQTLYKQDPQKWNSLYKQIVGNKAKTSTTGSTAMSQMANQLTQPRSQSTVVPESKKVFKK